ncbi:hypothetical protein [Levilactobacillus bambusae]|uniref:Uncharacterized protein n=1 Tax=Levilactobacillus bambusae TaxID=2024736 RepID=A0A2V1N0M1_9LACO|nr:hypothetical protein [Levilactobacillus bambusae]PWG00563.1 hypothetical protein DCM90_06475 [Levilactobacillus bambusae]
MSANADVKLKLIIMATVGILVLSTIVALLTRHDHHLFTRFTTGLLAVIAAMIFILISAVNLPG